MVDLKELQRAGQGFPCCKTLAKERLEKWENQRHIALCRFLKVDFKKITYIFCCASESLWIPLKELQRKLSEQLLWCLKGSLLSILKADEYANQNNEFIIQNIYGDKCSLNWIKIIWLRKWGHEELTFIKYLVC